MSKASRSASKYYILLLLGSYLYLTLTLISPITSNPYRISPTVTHLLQLTVVIPVVLIWAAAFYGAVKLKSYALTIQGSPEARPLNKISSSLLVLAIGLMTTSIYGAFRPWFINSSGLSNFTIINNYLSLLFPLIAFVLFYQGAVGLNKLVKRRKSKPQVKFVIIAVVLVLAALYTNALFNNPYLNTTPDPTRFRSFYLADWLISLTIILPNALIWLLGSLSAYNLINYAAVTKGEIYKKSLKFLVAGITSITLFSALLAFFSTISYLLVGWGLKEILAFVYAIIVFYAFGYLVIAYAAKKLTLIEEA